MNTIKQLKIENKAIDMTIRQYVIDNIDVNECYEYAKQYAFKEHDRIEDDINDFNSNYVAGFYCDQPEQIKYTTLIHHGIRSFVSAIYPITNTAMSIPEFWIEQREMNDIAKTLFEQYMKRQ